ncbi:uncharacterized protein J3R85_020293 [Psidium guajava]|nr:uncharacterized protein J3R85_020293 [Psidium guajava]
MRGRFDVFISLTRNGTQTLKALGSPFLLLSLAQLSPKPSPSSISLSSLSLSLSSVIADRARTPLHCTSPSSSSLRGDCLLA